MMPETRAGDTMVETCVNAGLHSDNLLLCCKNLAAVSCGSTFLRFAWQLMLRLTLPRVPMLENQKEENLAGGGTDQPTGFSTNL